MNRRIVLSDGERAALPNILADLDLGEENLSPHAKKVLCELFHSMAYNDRRDGLQVAARLGLLLMFVRAMSRAETMTTIAGGTRLQELLEEVTQALQGLALGVEAA